MLTVIDCGADVLSASKLIGEQAAAALGGGGGRRALGFTGAPAARHRAG
jgi:hypothetical protein